MDGLACALGNAGRHAEAAEMHRTTLEARRRVLGEEHPDTLRSMVSLAMSKNKMYPKIVEAMPHVRGKEHPGRRELLVSTVLGFRVGSTVVIQGVRKKPELNGQTGTVLGAQGAERVQVRLASGVGVALKPTNLRESSESGL